MFVDKYSQELILKVMNIIIWREITKTISQQIIQMKWSTKYSIRNKIQLQGSLPRHSRPRYKYTLKVYKIKGFVKCNKNVYI